MIPVTKPYLPDRDKLARYIDDIYERNWLTNNGPLVRELTRRLEEYLGVSNLLLVSNGTLALQIAFRSLGLGGHCGDEHQEAVTTPFSFVATASSLRWEGICPVFGDIDPRTWCLDPATIEPNITPLTRAIVPVHVFGNSCEVEVIDEIASRHRLAVIYDGAHAFGVNYKGKSLLLYGDATTLSFHATKLFHTVEGGAVVFKHKEHFQRASELINFGFSGDGSITCAGINAKMNEFQAAMGLCVLDEIEGNLLGREVAWKAYEDTLKTVYQLQERHPQASNNYSYFPLLMRRENEVEIALEKLARRRIFGRRYFYPSLNTISGVGRGETGCNVSEDVARRILCLPLYSSIKGEFHEHVISSLREA